MGVDRPDRVMGTPHCPLTGGLMVETFPSTGRLIRGVHPGILGYSWGDP